MTALLCVVSAQTETDTRGHTHHHLPPPTVCNTFALALNIAPANEPLSLSSTAFHTVHTRY